VNKRLYVGNLSYDTTEKDLSDLFSQVGSVTFTKIINNPDGKSKGFGFVEMSTEKEAQAAVEKFNQYELQGRTIKVNEANPQRTTGTKLWQR
jgi:RNA recognition motif-containing protein